MGKTEGQLEAKASDAMVRFEVDRVGRGPQKERPLPGAVISDVTRQSVRSLRTDISTRHGERVIVFSLSGPVRVPSED